MLKCPSLARFAIEEVDICILNLAQLCPHFDKPKDDTSAGIEVDVIYSSVVCKTSVQS